MYACTMTLLTATITLFLVMDPLGNIPSFITILSPVEDKRRAFIILREAFFAFLILSIFLFAGRHMLHALGISEPALGISGGIILFLIALKMIFPGMNSQTRESNYDEPFIVPLAIPLLAGPSSLATVILFSTNNPHHLFTSFIAIIIASCLVTIILLFASMLRRVLGKKGLVAIERLMGMVLTTIAVQMFLNGLQHFFHLAH